MPDAEWMADLLTALLPALTAGAGWAAARLGRSRKTDRALREGVKGLLRAKVIDLGLHYLAARALPPYGLETLRSCYDPYIALGDGDPAVAHIMHKCEALPVCAGTTDDKEEGNAGNLANGRQKPCGTVQG